MTEHHSNPWSYLIISLKKEKKKVIYLLNWSTIYYILNFTDTAQVVVKNVRDIILMHNVIKY